MKKYLIYLNERFALQTHIPIIGIFTFSAICFSLMTTENPEFIELGNFAAAVFLTFSTFFLLRISDEFKDHDDDIKYRKYLPVPRGLITLKELRNAAVLILILQIAVLYFFPHFAGMYVLVMAYLYLMYKEFFVHAWLKERQLLYVFSHMAIIPLVDLLASAAHWSGAGIPPPKPLIWFFLVSFFNGMVLEFGRKIKTKDMEEEGVASYTKLYGIKGGILLWASVLTLTYLLSNVAAYSIHSPFWVYILLSVFYVTGLIPGILFLKNPTPKGSKLVEAFSGLWTMGMYLNIGALPFIIKYWIQ